MLDKILGQLNFSALSVIDNSIYAIVQGTNWLVQIDTNTLKVAFVDVLLGEPAKVGNPVSYQLLSSGTLLIAVFRNCRSITIYNTDNSRQVVVRYECETDIENAFVYKGKVYLFPSNIKKCPISIELTTLQVNYEEWFAKKIDTIYESDWASNCWRMQYDDGFIWTVVAEKPFILKVDLEKEDILLIEIGYKCQLHTILKVGNVIYASCVGSNDILSLTIEQSSDVNIWKGIIDKNVKFPYFRLIEIDGTIYALSHDLRSEGVAFRLVNGNLVTVKNPNLYQADYATHIKNGRFHTNAFEFENRFFLTPEKSNYLVEIVENKAVCHNLSGRYLVKSSRFLEKVFFQQSYFIEKDKCDIDSFINIIAEME